MFYPFEVLVSIVKFVYLSLYLQELFFDVFVLVVVLITSITHGLVDAVNLRLCDFTLLDNLPLGAFAVLRHLTHKFLDLSIETLQCFALDCSGLHGIFEESCNALGQM